MRSCGSSFVHKPTVRDDGNFGAIADGILAIPLLIPATARNDKQLSFEML